MKKVLVIGASGLLGSQVVSQLGQGYEVISAALHDANYPVDISDETSLAQLFEKVGPVDAIVCTAGMVNFAPWEEAPTDAWNFGLANKLMGQINIVRQGRRQVNNGGAIVLTTGLLAQYPSPGSAIVSSVNAALEAAIATIKVELDDSVRVGAVSPGWVTETLVAMGMDPEPGLPAAEVAAKYVTYIESGEHGQIIPAAKGM